MQLGGFWGSKGYLDSFKNVLVRSCIACNGRKEHELQFCGDVLASADANVGVFPMRGILLLYCKEGSGQERV